MERDSTHGGFAPLEESSKKRVLDSKEDFILNFHTKLQQAAVSFQIGNFESLESVAGAPGKTNITIKNAYGEKTLNFHTKLPQAAVSFQIEDFESLELLAWAPGKTNMMIKNAFPNAYMRALGASLIQ